jgi:hypothetical protein
MIDRSAVLVFVAADAAESILIISKAEIVCGSLAKWHSLLVQHSTTQLRWETALQ